MFSVVDVQVSGRLVSYLISFLSGLKLGGLRSYGSLRSVFFIGRIGGKILVHYGAFPRSMVHA